MTPENSRASAIAAEVKAQLKDPAKLFGVLVRFQVKEGMQGRFEAEFAKVIRVTRKEKGVAAYELNRDTKDTRCYFLNERWKNFPALEAHLRMACVTALLGEMKDILAGAPEFHVLTPAGE